MFCFMLRQCLFSFTVPSLLFWLALGLPAAAADGIYVGTTSGTYEWVSPSGAKQPALSGTPSCQLHGGARWHLQVLPSDGTTWSPNHLFAVREDGGDVVQLTDGNVYVYEFPFGRQMWAKDDTFASFVGVYESVPGVYQDALFVQTVSFDANGRPEEGTLSAIAIVELVGNTVDTFDWSADGTLLVYDDISGASPVVRVLDLLTNTLLFEQTGIYAPVFSNTGKIAYRKEGSSAGVYVANPNGSAAVRVASDGSSFQAHYPTFSPDGSKVAYEGRTFKKSRGGITTSYSTRTVNSSGGKSSTIVNDAAPLVWR